MYYCIKFENFGDERKEAIERFKIDFPVTCLNSAKKAYFQVLPILENRGYEPYYFYYDDGIHEISSEDLTNYNDYQVAYKGFTTWSWWYEE